MQKISEMHTQPKATLILEDGSRFEGYSFGAPVGSGGEVVFNTAMTGYPESLTDPSYEGQILVTTYPLLGNYGVPAKAGAPSSSLDPHFESSRIHCAGIICQEYSRRVSHYLSGRTLSDWLREEGIPGLTGIDTRALTKLLREKGSMLGRIVMEGEREAGEFYDPNKEN
ncbi:MAG: carbamoyl-phosphate synthase domain-containing protein, partial [Lepagella sp.]